MSLFTVRFTTKKFIIKLDAKGREIGRTQMDSEICLTALPYATAQSYAGCDNFVMSSYVPDDRFKRQSKGSGRDDSVGNGTKKFDRNQYRERPAISQASSRGVVAKKSTVETAAATGNMAAAING